MAELPVEGLTPQVVRYKGQNYDTSLEGRPAEVITRSLLPETLVRIIPAPLPVFIEDQLLSPEYPTDINNMVTLSYPEEWEKQARMIHANNPFCTVTIRTKNLIGPIYRTTSRVLRHGEVLVLVPTEAIMRVDEYIWGKAEEGYDYGENQYTDEHDKQAYTNLVVNPSRGIKPVRVKI